MNELYNDGLLASLKQLSTSQLEDMLRSEAQKEQPEPYTVRAILKILRQRDADKPVETNGQIDAAWQNFRRKTEKKSGGFRKPFLKAATILVACGLLLAVFTQDVSANRLLERLAAWTDSIFELFSREHRGKSTGEYVFQTDNPGLQELYDTVSQLGVTVPVIPMWLDGEYELDYCTVKETPTGEKVVAGLINGSKIVSFEINMYKNEPPREFHKNEPDAEPYESNGVVHYIFKNHGLWVIVWARDNLECFLTIENQEDAVYRTINSIYGSEE